MKTAHPSDASQINWLTQRRRNDTMPCSRCKAATIELPSGRCEHGTPNEFDRGVARLVTESVQAACERATTDGHLKHRSTIVNRRFAASQARNPPRIAQPFGSGVMCPETRNPSEAALCVPKRATLRKRRKPESQGRHPANSYPPAFSFSLGSLSAPTDICRSVVTLPRGAAVLARHTCQNCGVSNSSTLDNRATSSAVPLIGDRL